MDDSRIVQGKEEGTDVPTWTVHIERPARTVTLTFKDAEVAAQLLALEQAHKPVVDVTAK